MTTDQGYPCKPASAESGEDRTARPETRGTLELRLEDGFKRIDVARMRGEDVSAWEDFWIELLHRYETLCDGERIAA